MRRIFGTWFRVACALIAWAVFVDCASTSSVANQRTATSQPQPRMSAPSAQAPRCRNVRNAPRTFVGVPVGQPLNDYTAIAKEAGLALGALKRQLCVLPHAQDPGGELRAALERGSAEISALRFMSADVAVAEVALQPPTVAGELAPVPPTPWLVRVERAEAGWHVVSASAQ